VLAAKPVPVTVIVEPTLPALADRDMVSGVTTNCAEAIIVEPPLGKRST
jgi:hypothetical protein